eukprot:scaffold94074_cov33-Tisochrysis_lutea.AAC.4
MPRGYPHAVMVVSSTEVTLQGISAYGSTNMGILENGGQGANEYIDDTVSPRPDRCDQRSHAMGSLTHPPSLINASFPPCDGAYMRPVGYARTISDWYLTLFSIPNGMAVAI